MCLKFAAMYIHNAPFWLRWLYPSQLEWMVSTHKKEVFLTFDDGPIPEITPLVLDILQTEGIRATFFCVGENVVKHPEIFQQLHQRGHQTGNHAYHHNQAFKTPYSEYLAEVDRCNQLVHSNLFRPPHGQITPRLAKELSKQYRIVMWTMLTGDFDKNLSKEQCLQLAIKYTKPGAILVFHDSLKASERLLWVLPRYIEYCKSNGYSFGQL